MYSHWYLFALLAVTTAAELSNIENLNHYGRGEINGTNYYIDLIPRVWQSSVDNCHALGMKLVSIESSEKDSDLYVVLDVAGYGDTKLWSSGKKFDGGQFVWTELNNETFTYTRWAAGEPNDLDTPTMCMHFSSREGWFDTICEDMSPTLCEML